MESFSCNHGHVRFSAVMLMVNQASADSNCHCRVKFIVLLQSAFGTDGGVLVKLLARPSLNAYLFWLLHHLTLVFAFHLPPIKHWTTVFSLKVLFASFSTFGSVGMQARHLLPFVTLSILFPLSLPRWQRKQSRLIISWCSTYKQHSFFNETQF
jgi:hypothetical protein